MPLRRRLSACLLLLLCASPLAARELGHLPPEVERVMSQRRIPGTSLSVVVREVGRDQPLVSYNSAVPRNPASTMKVLTTYAALELLGPAYTWRTRAYAVSYTHLTLPTTPYV
jgi:D-alanyl-D-alanine carboxypeptidase/D-alanyl-D-alanine-endopeptidase (penicillin-binding protein 4)